MVDRDEKGEEAEKKAYADLAERISQAINLAGGIRAAMRDTGISDTQLRRYVKGEATPSASKLAKIAEFTGKSPEWFLIGDVRAVLEERRANSFAAKGDLVTIPILNVRAAAGAGAINGEIEDIATVSLPRAFLHERGARSDRVQFIRATGDSMSPTIEDGALVLVDRSQHSITDGSIYVVSMGDEVRIKRLHKTLSGKITLRSDGDKAIFPDEELDRHEAGQLVVHGRVFWTERLL